MKENIDFYCFARETATNCRLQSDLSACNYNIKTLLLLVRITSIQNELSFSVLKKNYYLDHLIQAFEYPAIDSQDKN